MGEGQQPFGRGVDFINLMAASRSIQPKSSTTTQMTKANGNNAGRSGFVMDRLIKAETSPDRIEINAGAKQPAAAQVPKKRTPLFGKVARRLNP